MLLVSYYVGPGAPVLYLVRHIKIDDVIQNQFVWSTTQYTTRMA
jgi:hypothetical protein